MTDAPFHDTGYKALFSLPELVQQLIEGFVTPDIAQLLDFSTLELVAGSFVTPAMQSREEDVVWRVKMADTTLYLYLLLEFQSTPDAAMPVRMVQYVAALYDSLIKGSGLTRVGCRRCCRWCCTTGSGGGGWRRMLGR